MAFNRQARTPGAIHDFDGKAQISRGVASPATGGDEAFNALMRVSAGLSGKFGEMADRAAASEGRDAGLAAGQAAGAQVDDDSFAVSPPQPLALRRDHTIRGEAYDKAALAAAGWRDDLALTTGIAQAYDQAEGDPAKLDEALAAVRQPFEQGLAGDPERLEAFRRTFEDRSVTYRLKAQTEAEAKADAEMKAAGRAALDEKIGEFGKQLYLLGSNPAGEAISATLMKQGTAAIEQAVTDGVISPAEGNRLVAEYGTAAVTMRLAGVFEALPDGQARLKFAEGLTEAWANDDGPLGKVDKGAIDTLQARLAAKARHEISGEDRASRTEQNAMRQAVKDDLSSIMSSGEELATGLTFEQVQATLGEADAVKWRDERAYARAYYGQTGDFSELTAEQIADRVVEMEPKPGQEGFERQEKLFEAVHRQATRVLQDRMRDPALAVNQFAPVMQAQAELNEADPASWDRLISARMAAQGALDIPDNLVQPLTQAEAEAYGKPLLGVEMGADSLKLVQDYGRHLEAKFGPHADEVMTQILRMKGVDRDVARLGQAVMKRLNLGQQPTAAETTALETASEAAAADAAMTGTGPAARAGQAETVYPRPNAKALQRLMANPGLSAQFDEAFGPGQAEHWLSRQGKAVTGAQATPQGGVLLPEDGGTAIYNPDGSEDWAPDE